MANLIYTENEFLSLFSFNKTVSFEDFSNQISVLNGSDTSGNFVVRSDLDTFIERVAKSDDRKDRLNLYKEQMYKMLVLEPEVALTEWFRKTAKIAEPIEHYFQIPPAQILNGDTFAGRTYSKYGRICKNINFEKFFSTRKLYSNDFEYTFGLLKVMFEQFKIRNSLASPAFFDHICKIENSNYGQFWTDFMIGCNRASIFNPATYKGILDEILPGKILFAPVMGWNSYQFAFYSSGFEKFIATDVIPEVVENGKTLHKVWQDFSDKSFFGVADKSVDLYCCPSEKLKSIGFEDTYREKVDAVLFSPPYYDLEIYDSEDQSFTNYPNYEEWLEKYWEATVLTAKEVMKPDANFAFVISNYRNKAKQEVNISEDMMRVVSKHLNLKARYKIQWSAIGTGRQAKKTRGGNFEDLWVFTK